MSQNAISDGVAERVAQQTLADRTAGYASEVRALLDAGLEVMARCGTESRPRVADIVAAAGLSNDAFYRHFRSKDALVAAILEDGTERLRSYVAHQMEKASTPEAQVRAWVEGVLSQAAPDVAATTLAVLWNGGSLADGPPTTVVVLAPLLVGPFDELGSADPDADAALAAHAVVGTLSDLLWGQQPPTEAAVDRVTAFCVNAVSR